jgi:hypothetical protein
LDCGGKRSATPLSPARRFTLIRTVSIRLKAPSPLRSADAVQDAPQQQAVHGEENFPRGEETPVVAGLLATLASFN